MYICDILSEQSIEVCVLDLKIGKGKGKDWADLC
jgi:hypothetical protein